MLRRVQIKTTINNNKSSHTCSQCLPLPKDNNAVRNFELSLTLYKIFPIQSVPYPTRLIENRKVENVVTISQLLIWS